MTFSAAAIITAAGFGTRMKLGHPKQYHLLAGIPILVHTVRAFVENNHINRIVVVVPADWIEQTNTLFTHYQINDTNLVIVAGGKRRQDSVQAGLKALDDDTAIVLVHDGARPLVSREIIDRCYLAALQSGAAIAAVPVKDTLKRADDDGKVTATIDRTSLWQAQTPQAIRKDLLAKAFKYNGDADVTDESSLLENAAIPVTLVAGAESNIKITHPEDLLLAEKIIQRHVQPRIRIGHGYDAHRFADNRKLVLGGIVVPHSQGLTGHSDADVLTHALCDAVLGALGLGDIGRHFPDSDENFSGIYSITLLEHVIALASEQGYGISNADITLICQSPRLAPYIDEMRDLLGRTCKVDPSALNIKATTTEKMGFTGRKEGISCHAVVLLQSNPNEAFK
jgi:2-C-methyl-D-erythritol 4-phosphate cytidylyltransferase/2-C-methyl-D-erythritol 2,4-cyclodiphosphate synthase